MTRNIGKKKSAEVGIIKKDWGGKVPVAIVYPNTYYIGMSNLAVHLLYKLLNNDPRIVAERIFLSDKKIVSEESKRPISDFHTVAFSFSFETDYLNIPKILGKSIPLLREDRDERHPILFAGGPAVILNPTALADIFDVLVVGEAEDMLGEACEILKEPIGKWEALNKLAKVKGIWVPDSNDVRKVERVYTADLDKHPTHSVIWTDDTEFGHMHLVEVARGCPWRCKFCATPPLYRPYRTRGAETIWESIEYGLPHRKHIGLIGADVLGHPDFGNIASKLTDQGIKVSTSSLRVNRITKDIASILARSGHKRATLGVEAGTERLRKVIDKSLSDKDIFAAITNLSGEGITNLKLYFMIGLPGETDDDIQGIANLTREIRKIVLKERRSKMLAPNISLVATPFVPKKTTPFAEKPFAGIPYLTEKIKQLRKLIQKIPNTKLTGDSPKKAHIEYLLSQGDPRSITELIKTD